MLGGNNQTCDDILMEDEGIRLARLEEKHLALCERMERFCDAVESEHRDFRETRDKVERMEARASVIASLGVIVSGMIAAVASYLSSR